MAPPMSLPVSSFFNPIGSSMPVFKLGAAGSRLKRSMPPPAFSVASPILCSQPSFNGIFVIDCTPGCSKVLTPVVTRSRSPFRNFNCAVGSMMRFRSPFRSVSLRKSVVMDSSFAKGGCGLTAAGWTAGSIAGIWATVEMGSKSFADP